MPQGTFRSLTLPSNSVRKGSINLLHLTNLDLKSDKLTASLRDTLYSEDYSKFTKSLTDAEISVFVNFLDKSLDYISADAELFHKSLRALRNLCGRIRQLPSSYEISERELVRGGYHPVASGGFSDVWIGTFGQRKVALRYLKMSQGNSVKIPKASAKVAHWKHTTEVNNRHSTRRLWCGKDFLILPLLGVSNVHSLPCIVSTWMIHGSIINHLRTRPKENRIGLLSQTAEGLKYLHSLRVVHGDLKGSNILIDDFGRVRLADFGLTSITTDDSYNVSLINNDHGNPRWMAPEILNVEGLGTTQPSLESDVYAFAMVVVEVFTCKLPFPGLGNAAVLIRIVGGQRPPRPEARELGLSDSLWGMVERCWKQDPAQRPKISEVLDFFNEVAAARPLPHTPGRVVPL